MPSLPNLFNSPIRRNIIGSFLGQGTLMLLSLVATRFIFSELGGEILGVINFSIVFASLLTSFSDLGMSMVVTREVAAYRTQDREYVHQLVCTVALIAWVLFGLMTCLFVFLTPLAVDHWLHFVELDPNEVLFAIQIIGVSLLLALPRAMYGAVLSGFERVDLVNFANVSSVGFQHAALIILLNFGGDLNGVAYCYAFSAVLGVLLFMYYMVRIGGKELLGLSFNLSVIKKNLSFGSRLFANSIAGYAISQADRWIVSKMLSVSVLGYYGFIHGLVSKGYMIPNAIANAAFPSLSASMRDGDQFTGITQYQKLQDLCCYLFIPVSAAVGLIGLVITRLVFNELVVTQIWTAVIFLAIGLLIQGAVSIPQWLAVSMKKPDIALRTNLLAIPVILPLALYLTKQYGIAGASLSSILYGLWQVVYFIPRFCRECLDRSPQEWFRTSFGLGGVGFITYGLSWGIAWSVGLGLEPVGLIVAYLVGTFFFIPVAWFFIGEGLKNIIRGFAKETLNLWK